MAACVFVCVFVCVKEKERQTDDRETERGRKEKYTRAFITVCNFKLCYINLREVKTNVKKI